MRTFALVLGVAGILISVGSPRAEITRLPPETVAGIAALGPTLDRPMVAKTNELMKGLAPMTPPPSVTVTQDVAYGDDPLQKVDIYAPAKARTIYRSRCSSMAAALSVAIKRILPTCQATSRSTVWLRSMLTTGSHRK